MIRRWAPLALTLLAARPLCAQPAFDAASSVQGGAVSSLTIPAWTVSGANRLVFVGVGSSATASDFTSSVVRNVGVTFVAAALTSSTTATTTDTVTIPASTATDDLLYLHVTSRDATGTAPTVTDNDTGGNAWATIAADSNNKSTLWWKRATSGTASKTITIASAVGCLAGTLKTYRGGDAGGTPHTNITTESNASGDETHAGYTPANADSFIDLAVGNTANDNAVSTESTTNPGTLNEDGAERLSTGGLDCASVQASTVQVGGPTATGSHTWAQTNGTTVSHVWAIKPASSPESCTEIWDVKNTSNGSDAHNSGHYFVAPATGSYSVTVTLAGTDDEVAAGAMSLTGVHQTTPIGTQGTAEGTGTTTATVTVTAASDELLVDNAYVFDTALDAGADQTSRWEQESIGGFAAAGGSTQAGTANDGMSWTFATANDWLIGAVPVKPVGGGPTCSTQMSLLGVGCK